MVASSETYEPKLNARNSEVQKEQYIEIIFKQYSKRNASKGKYTGRGQSNAASSDTVEQFSIYHTLLSDDSDTEPDRAVGTT